MANIKHVNSINRKGKPSGNGRENETLQEASGESREIENLDTTDMEVQHPNRHLLKGDVLKTFKDNEQ